MKSAFSFRSQSGWDVVVRAAHWIVAILFISNYYFTEPGYDAHIYSGYTIAGLVVFRLLWGLTLANGPNRLDAFFPTLAGAKFHIQEIRQRLTPEKVGHNAFGTLAIYLMWLGLLAAAFTGWFQDTDWGFDNDVNEWHEIIVESLWWLIVLHITAVIVTSIWLRKNLILAMLKGNS